MWLRHNEWPAQCSPSNRSLRYRATHSRSPTHPPTSPRRFTPEVLQGVVAALRDGDDHQYGCGHGEYDDGPGGYGSAVHDGVGPGHARGAQQVPQLDLIYLDCTFADLPLVGTAIHVLPPPITARIPLHAPLHPVHLDCTFADLPLVGAAIRVPARAQIEDTWSILLHTPAP